MKERLWLRNWKLVIHIVDRRAAKDEAEHIIWGEESCPPDVDGLVSLHQHCNVPKLQQAYIHVVVKQVRVSTGRLREIMIVTVSDHLWSSYLAKESGSLRLGFGLRACARFALRLGSKLMSCSGYRITYSNNGYCFSRVALSWLKRDTYPPRYVYCRVENLHSASTFNRSSVMLW